MLGDPQLKEDIVRKQLTRLPAFSMEAVAGRLREMLAPWL
jgi:hypothetical protein